MFGALLIGVGSKIGGYEILHELRAGGMATLYLARKVGAAGFARHVAIKVVHPHLARDRGFVNMFLDEAMLCVRIQHPNVVHVEELGESDGAYFLAMEYVRGCSLWELMRQLAKLHRGFTSELAAWLAIQVADGLHAAHETCGDNGESLHVVHRDVSPQNVLLSYAGHVKVIDFGIAKARGRLQQNTAGGLKGKIAYMSPEQAFGKPLDRRTDVYALGVVLWEMLAMRRAFKAENDFALLELVRDPKLVAPGTLVEGVPPALDRALLSALATNADDRPATAQAFRRMLLDAVPAAAALDASALAALLGGAMSDRIEAERETLPESVSGVGRRPHAPDTVVRDPGETLGAHTISLTSMPTDALVSDDASDDSIARPRPPAISRPTPSFTVPAIAHTEKPPAMRSQMPRAVMLAAVGAVCFAASGTVLYMRRGTAHPRIERASAHGPARVAAPTSVVDTSSAAAGVVDVVEPTVAPAVEPAVALVVAADVVEPAEAVDAATIVAVAAPVSDAAVAVHHHVHGNASPAQPHRADTTSGSTSGPLVSDPGF